MATVIKEILRLYTYLNDEVSDPRCSHWLLVRTPFPLLAILFGYLYFVHVLGPKLMAQRAPFNLDRIMQLYNVFQIILNAYLFYKGMTVAWLTKYKLVCEPVDYAVNPYTLEVVQLVYIYFLMKLADLLDTIFFVLRKKQNQISFLHVYHHVGMALASWLCVKWLPGGHGTFVGMVNTFVHAVMYSHYLATSLKISKPWWKKYITQLQILQFIMIFCQFAALLFVKDCNYPKWVAAIMIPQNLFMIMMFSDFYYKTYVKKKSPKAAEQNATVLNGKTKTQ